MAGLTNCAVETFFISPPSGQKPRWKFLISGHWIVFPFGQGKGEGKRTESRRSGKAGKTCRRRHSPISRTSPEPPMKQRSSSSNSSRRPWLSRTGSIGLESNPMSVERDESRVQIDPSILRHRDFIRTLSVYRTGFAFIFDD